MPDKAYIVYRYSASIAVPHFDTSQFAVLRPTMRTVFRCVPSYPLFIVWWAFHRSGVFSNKDFSMIALLEGGRILHRTCVFPRFYKFPFMGKNDVQLGEIWTRGDFRHRGIASKAINCVLNLESYRNKTLWYVVEEDNADSIRLAERAGFLKYSAAEKKRRLGISALGEYQIHMGKPE